MLDEIEALHQEQIAPTLPDISGSLHLLLGQAQSSSVSVKSPDAETEPAPDSETEKSPANEIEKAPDAKAEEPQP
jgi:hypothetical protein